MRIDRTLTEVAASHEACSLDHLVDGFDQWRISALIDELWLASRLNDLRYINKSRGLSNV
jgi:hypothetical protein